MADSFGASYAALTTLLNGIVEREEAIDFIGVAQFQELVVKKREISKLDDIFAHTNLSGTHMRLILAILKLENWHHEINPCREDNMRVGKNAVYRVCPTNRDGEVILFCSFSPKVDPSVLRATAKYYVDRIVDVLGAIPIEA